MLHIRAKLLLFASEFVRISEIALPVEDSLKSVVVSAFKWLNARKSEEWPLRYRKRHKCKKNEPLGSSEGQFFEKILFQAPLLGSITCLDGDFRAGHRHREGSLLPFFFFFFLLSFAGAITRNSQTPAKCETHAPAYIRHESTSLDPDAGFWQLHGLTRHALLSLPPSPACRSIFAIKD